MSLANSAVINNSGTLDFDGDGAISGDATSKVVNTGTVTKSAVTPGDSNPQSGLDTVLGGSGVVSASKGQLELGCTSSGPPLTQTLGANSGASILIDGTYAFGKGAKVTGNVELGADIGFAAGAIVPFTGTNIRDLHTLSGPGTLQVSAGSTLSIPVGCSMSALKLSNLGTVKLAADSISLDTTTTIDNRGTLSLGDANIYTNDPDSTILNEGTISKSVGTGVAELQPNLTNAGALAASAGRLEIDGVLEQLRRHRQDADRRHVPGHEPGRAGARRRGPDHQRRQPDAQRRERTDQER